MCDLKTASFLKNNALEPIKIYSTKKFPVNKLRAEFLLRLNVSFLPLILAAVVNVCVSECVSEWVRE